MELTAVEIRRAVRAALAEDLGSGDVTTLATVPATAKSVAFMNAREPLTVAGLAFAELAFREVAQAFQPAGAGDFLVASSKHGTGKSREPADKNVCATVIIKTFARDGQRVKAGAPLLKISGSSRALLSAERVALNFVQRLSGVATATAQFSDLVRGTHAKILDTRKTTPGWRRFEKYAVACGGGKNHRIGLFDMVLIKDNHLVALQNEKPNAIAAAVARARQKFPKLKVEVEADTLAQVAQAADAGADIILLDNMTPAQLRSAVKIVRGRAQTEASGGVNLKTVRGIAQTGVDFISVGAITHSARAVDIGLDFA